MLKLALGLLPVVCLGLSLNGVSLPAMASDLPAASSSSDLEPSSPELAQHLLDQGRSLYQGGQFAAAAVVWEQAATFYTAQYPLEQALTLNYLSLAYQELNQWEAAWQAIDQSLNTLQQPDSLTSLLVLAQVLSTQAKLFMQRGELYLALDNWQRAEALYHQVGDREGVLGSQINQARALQSLGFYRRSQHQLQNVTEQLAELPDSELKISSLRSLGLAYQVTGNLEASRAALQKSLAIAQNLGAVREMAATCLILGRTAIDLQDSTTAFQAFDQAEQLSQNPLEQVQARLGLLELLQEQEARERLGERSGSPAGFNEIAEELEEGTATVASLAEAIEEQLLRLPPSRARIYASINLAATLHPNPSVSTSRSPTLSSAIPTPRLVHLLTIAVESARQLQDVQAEAYTLHQLAQLYAQNGQIPPALSLSQEALRLARQIQADDIAAQAAWRIGYLLKYQWEQGGKQSPTLYQEALFAYDQAIAALQALRGDLLAINPEVQFSFRTSVEPVYREMVALLLAEEPSQTDLIRARELIEALQLAELDNFFREACFDRPLQSVDEVDPEAVVIYPILLPDRLAVILSQGGQYLHYYSTPIPQAEAQTQLETFVGSLNPAFNNDVRLQLSQQVYDWLIRPAEAANLLHPDQTLVFVLDSSLQNLPMAALYDGEHYLIEKYAIALSPGLQLMAGEPLHNPQAVIGGISEAREGFTALPEVKTEVEQVSQLVKASILLNEQFTRRALAEQVQSTPANIVHLATHGQFSSRQEDTFLLTWDGRLSIQDLEALLQPGRVTLGTDAEASPDRPIVPDRPPGSTPAPAVDLLILSACDTAVGDDRAVLGLAGLAVRSGARSTVAAMWSLRDQVAAQLVTSLYGQFSKPGMTKAEALRQAQLDILHNSPFQHPFFWAGFVLVGHWL